MAAAARRTDDRPKWSPEAEEWFERQLALAPPLSPETRARVERILSTPEFGHDITGGKMRATG